MRTALLIAYHFPPCHGSSGMQRTLRFAQHLPAFGWKPVVLTIHPRAYAARSHAAGNEIPADLVVHRAPGFDTARHLSLFGKYPGALALPDRWALWKLGAVPAARRLTQRHNVQVIWSTFPIATAHGIGLAVAQQTCLPWIAEFRDPMWQGDTYPADPRTNRYWKRLEQQIFDHASRVVMTTPSAIEEYARRFPAFGADRMSLIENGYDEEIFQRAEVTLASAGSTSNRSGPVTLVHSGIIYPWERDPTQFFRALANLKQRGCICPGRLRILLRATANDERYRPMLSALQIDDIVSLAPSIDYLDAIREMLTVDGLLLLQASNCNAQVPAKLYEYVRAGKPILALTDPVGDTARTLRSLGTGIVAPLDNHERIEAAVLELLEQIEQRCWTPADPAAVASRSRREQASRLARLFDSISAP
jgi:glycosyltransferase involved in cell wall biosynthesis